MVTLKPTGAYATAPWTRPLTIWGSSEGLKYGVSMFTKSVLAVVGGGSSSICSIPVNPAGTTGRSNGRLV